MDNTSTDNVRYYNADRSISEQLFDGSWIYYLEVDATRKRVLPIRIYLPEGQRAVDTDFIRYLTEQRDAAIKEAQEALRRENETNFHANTMPFEIKRLKTEVENLNIALDKSEKELCSRKSEYENCSSAFLKLRDKISLIFELKDEFEFKIALQEAYRAELSKQGFHCREEFAWWTFHRCDKCLPSGFFNSWENQPTANMNVYYAAWQVIQRRIRAIINPYLIVPKEDA